MRVADGLHTMKILSFGAGMQSTALALMSIENAVSPTPIWPKVPVYDHIIYCDMGLDSQWVTAQMLFVKAEAEKAGIPFTILKTDLYGHWMQNFGERRTVSVPWWTKDKNGKAGAMPRYCTLDFKVDRISIFMKTQILGYPLRARFKKEDIKAHELHLGFSFEESHRKKDNPHKLWVNHYPLIDMYWERIDAYSYLLERWGLDTKASACAFCPYHTNYHFNYIKETEPVLYQQITDIDVMLETKTMRPMPLDGEAFISHSLKRLRDLTPEDCNDAKYICYCGKQIWTGF